MDWLYYLVMPLTSAFNFSAIFIWPILISFVAILVALVTGRVSHSPHVKVFDIFAIAFCGSAAISAALNYEYLSEKSINHLFAVIVSFLCYYMLPSRFTVLDKNRLFYWISWGVFLSLVFGILEFFVVNFTSIDIVSIVPRPLVEEYTPLFLDAEMIRARSLFEESGYFAQYMCVCAPIYLYTVFKSSLRIHNKLGAIIALLLNIAFVFSPSVFFIFPICAILTLVIRAIYEGRLSKLQVMGFLCVVTLLAVSITNSQAFDFFFGRKADSYGDRLLKFEVTRDVMKSASSLNFLFGFGPGSYFKLDVLPAISVYLNIWRDYGFIGLILFVCFVITGLISSLKIAGPYGYICSLGMMFILIGYISSPAYYYPHCFLPFVLLKIWNRGSKATANVAVASRSSVRALS